MDDAIKALLAQAERLLRRADNAVENAVTPAVRQRRRKQRNAINAACNALHRATKA
jgi:hypothetical protein